MEASTTLVPPPSEVPHHQQQHQLHACTPLTLSTADGRQHQRQQAPPPALHGEAATKGAHSARGPCVPDPETCAQHQQRRLEGLVSRPNIFMGPQQQETTLPACQPFGAAAGWPCSPPSTLSSSDVPSVVVPSLDRPFRFAPQKQPPFPAELSGQAMPTARASQAAGLNTASLPKPAIPCTANTTLVRKGPLTAAAARLQAPSPPIPEVRNGNPSPPSPPPPLQQRQQQQPIPLEEIADGSCFEPPTMLARRNWNHDPRKSHPKGGAQPSIIGGGFSGGNGIAKITGGEPIKTCCHRLCYNRWPLEKLAKARSAIPQSIRALPSSSASGSVNRSDSDAGTGDAGDDGGDPDASAKAHVKSCLAHDRKMLYITSGRESLPVCRAFFVALTGISKDVIDSVAGKIAGARKIEPTGRQIKQAVSQIKRSVGMIDPVTRNKQFLASPLVQERCTVTASPHWPSDRTREEVNGFIKDLASHWDRQVEGNWIAMTYPTKQMVYDLFVSTWNKHRTAKNGRPPPPSYAMFVGTWTRNFEHVILKRRQIKPRREQGQGQEQEQQYGGLHSSPPATCQIPTADAVVGDAVARWRRNKQSW